MISWVSFYQQTGPVVLYSTTRGLEYRRTFNIEQQEHKISSTYFKFVKQFKQCKILEAVPSAPIGALEVKIKEIIAARPTNGPTVHATDGQTGSLPDYILRFLTSHAHKTKKKCIKTYSYSPTSKGKLEKWSCHV